MKAFKENSPINSNETKDDYLYQAFLNDEIIIEDDDKFSVEKLVNGVKLALSTEDLFPIEDFFDNEDFAFLVNPMEKIAEGFTNFAFISPDFAEFFFFESSNIHEDEREIVITDLRNELIKEYGGPESFEYHLVAGTGEVLVLIKK